MGKTGTPNDGVGLGVRSYDKNYRVANTSAASTFGFFARAFLLVLSILASLKPACLNSSRKAPPSLAPLIQANQSASVSGEGFVAGPMRISSAAYTLPPWWTTLANSVKIA